MKKALLVTTISGFVPQFEMNSVHLLQENGYEVHYATNYNYVFYGKDNSRLDGTGIIRHQIDFARSPYSKQTYIAYRQLDKLMSENEFSVIHCHTPMAGILARFVGNKHHVPIVFYTAHGFHFYKGAAIVNWLVYYTAERIMAKYTDALLTINKEDYNNAQRFTLKKGGQVYYIAGAGIDTAKFKNIDVDKKLRRQELGLKDNEFVILSVGELNKNKNHEVVIRAIAGIEHENIKYIICGEGDYKEKLQHLIKELQLEKNVKLLGYRSDIPSIEKSVDMFAFPSFREGLPVSLMEAMASGLPVIASKVRGNVDLVKNGTNGYLADPEDVLGWAEKIQYLMKNNLERQAMSRNNQKDMANYDKKVVKKQLYSIYKEQGVF